MPRVVFTAHAIRRMRQRAITVGDVMAVLDDPVVELPTSRNHRSAAALRNRWLVVVTTLPLPETRPNVELRVVTAYWLGER